MLEVMNLHLILNTFYQKKTSSMKQADLWDMFVHQLLWYLLTPYLLLHWLLQLWRLENTEEDPDEPELPDEWVTQTEYSFD